MENGFEPVDPKFAFPINKEILEEARQSMPQVRIPDDIREQEEKMHEAVRQRSKQIEEQMQREKENSEQIKNISQLISAIEQSNVGNDKLSKRMLYLTIATVILAIIQITVGIISIVH